MTRSHFIEILMILTKYLFDLGFRTEFSVTVESVTLRFYCILIVCMNKSFDVLVINVILNYKLLLLLERTQYLPTLSLSILI